MTGNNVTIKDVAREAGVSFKTVSNVINGNDDQMRAETKDRVKDAIDRLGYRVNRSARALKTGRTGIIGLGVSDFDQPFEGHLANAITRVARARGYAVIVSIYGKDAASREEFAASSRRINADGWALLYEEPLDVDSPLFRQDHPVVLISDYSAQNRYDVVTMPNADAARTATMWLLGHDAKTIGFIGAPSELFSDRYANDSERESAILTAVEGNAALRLQGFIQAVRSCGGTVNWKYIMPCDRMTGLGGSAAAFDLIQRGDLPDALLCVNDAVAIGAISTLDKSGIRVPQDVQVCGFDNIPDGEFSTPPLTTIDPHIDEYATMAVDALIKRINGQDSAPNVYTSGFQLLERRSTLPA
ncbi:LacI family transcriptional regulator [Bifidobacterium goeldii]|uniref:LacI family transcriptional regulator n=1 Tax=Bifidobacterium goeldii TaxID=2306975 RepID=A0A430FIZ9_9BIFI|nr:LacI family DNA-binding transcriptional regulator [Bifidobacterium goeldii]RSX52884.1 LacI family transcriptional regulator [Bifidobacterium goeldii]